MLRTAVTASLMTGLLLASVAGCGRSSGSATAGGDCVSPFHFEGREYRLALRQEVPVEPGAELGHGAHESCDQYSAGGGSDRLVGRRSVYEFPGVPAAEAILLMSSEGGWVLLADEEPPDGWDPDLRTWMDRTSVE